MKLIPSQVCIKLWLLFSYGESYNEEFNDDYGLGLGRWGDIGNQRRCGDTFLATDSIDIIDVRLFMLESQAAKCK